MVFAHSSASADPLNFMQQRREAISASPSRA